MLLEHNFICNNKNNVIELYGAFLYEINYATYYMMCDYYCRVPVLGSSFHCRCEQTQTQQAQYNEFGREAGLRTGPL